MRTYRTISFSLLFVLLSAVAVSAQISAPAIVGPDDNERTTTTPTLHWEQLDNAGWYRVWINNTSTGNTHLKEWIKGSNSWTIPESQKLNPDDEYRYWVAGWNSSDKLGPWSNPANVQAGKKRTISYAPLNFNSRFPEKDAFTTTTSIDGYGFFKNGNGVFGFATTDLNLPVGAVIVKLEGWIYDNTSDNPVRVRVKRLENSGSSDDFIVGAEVESSTNNATSSVQHLTSSSINHTIDPDYAYWVQFQGVDNTDKTRLYGVKITYIK